MPIEWKPRRLEIFVIAAALAGACFILALAIAQARNVKRGQLCQSNLQQVGLGLSKYARDYDEFFPLKEKWTDALPLYTKNESIFHCPSVERFGYAMNQTLDSATQQQIEDVAVMPAIFETPSLSANFYGDATSFLREPRHAQGVALGYADGHVEWRKTPPPFPKIKPPPNKLPPIIIQQSSPPLVVRP